MKIIVIGMGNNFKFILLFALLLACVSVAHSVPIGISPASKTIAVMQGGENNTFFTISGAINGTPLQLDIKTNSDWITCNKSFVLDNVSKHLDLKVSVPKNAVLGNHTANILVCDHSYEDRHIVGCIESELVINVTARSNNVLYLEIAALLSVISILLLIKHYLFK